MPRPLTTNLASRTNVFLKIRISIIGLEWVGVIVLSVFVLVFLWLLLCKRHRDRWNRIVLRLDGYEPLRILQRLGCSIFVPDMKRVSARWNTRNRKVPCFVGYAEKV